MQSGGSKTITYHNTFPVIYRVLVLEIQVKYIEDIFVTRDTANLGMSRNEVIQVISDIGQANSYVQEENHLYYLIWEKRLPNLRRHGRVIKYQATTT